MKHTPLIILILFALSCTEKQSVSNETKSKLNIDGTWGLTNYLDSIIVHKKLAKHRVQKPPCFGILIDIQGDTLSLYGSLKNIKNKVNIQSRKDTIHLPNYFWGKSWIIVPQDSLLVLTSISKEKHADTNTYIYRKRDELNYMIREEKHQEFNKHLTNYFNQQLFTGDYINTETNDTISFRSDNTISGFKNFSHYQTRSYFGTRHPHKNLDVINFKTNASNSSIDYNWTFNNNELTLIKFIQETREYNGIFHETDDRIISNEAIILERL